MSEKNLKPHQHYSDQYDRFTVDECRRIEQLHVKSKIPPYKGKELSEEGKKSVRNMFTELHLDYVKGERQIKKAETIRKWMERDEERDRFFEKTRAPEDITCLTCGRIMFMSSKYLDYEFEKPDRVMFFYDCPLKHFPMRVFYDDGEEYRIKPKLCSKCKSPVEDNHKKEGDILKITSICKKCGNVDKDEIDFTPKKEVSDPNFIADRDRFCVSEEEGQKYSDFKFQMESVSKLLQEFKEKEKDKDSYDKVEKIKKLKIIELEQLLASVLEKADYIKFHFKEPEILRDVIVSFTTHDTKADRSERASQLDLVKIIKRTLNGTNWRLMSDGTHYRLGMLEGRLRAYEREEDLLKLVKGDETDK